MFFNYFFDNIARFYFQNLSIQILIGTLSILTVFAYILSTYISKQEFLQYHLFEIWMIVEIIAFTIDTFFSAYLALSTWGYLFSFSGIADIISLFFSLSFFFLPYHVFVTLGFFRCLRLLKIIRIVSMHQDFFIRYDDPIIFETFKLILKVIVLLLVFTGIAHSLSNLGTGMFYVSEGNPSGTGVLSWHRSLYFMIVTITTVGYGDIYPVSFVSQTIIIIIIIVSFGILPILAGSFVESLYARPEYSGSLSLPAGCAHVCIMGAVHPGMLNQLLNDFSSSSVQGEDRHPDSIYSSDETSQYMVEPVKLSRSGHPVFNTMIVLLSPGPPSQELKKILFSPEAHTRRAVYFTGSCKVVQDLERVKADQALAILVLSDEKTSSLREEEDSFFLSTVSLNMFLQRKLFSHMLQGMACTSALRIPRVITMLTHTAKPQIVLTTGGVDVVFPLQEFKYRLFGIGSALPGFLGVFAKLTQHPGWSSASHPDSSVTIHQINVTTQPTRDTHEIPSSESPLLQLLSKCSNCQFSHLAALLLRESMGRVILIGVKLIRQASEQTFKSKLVFSNPGSHVPLSSCQALFVISSTKLLAKKMLLTVLKKYVSSHPPCEGATPSSPKEPLYPCVSRLVSGRLSELKHPGSSSGSLSGPESHVLDLEETPELLQLCPFIRLEKDPTIAEAQQYEFFGHLVIIFSSSGSKDLVPPTALLMQILDFLESYRYYTHYPVPPDIPSSKVIIFSERADELVALTERMEFSQSSLLAGVSFYLGSPKNIDHLRLCRVVAAKTVVVLQPPVTYHSWITSSSSPLPSINEDKHTIVVSLNIHHLVHTALTQEMGSTPRPSYSVEQIVLNGFEDDNLRLPFFAAHLHDITNASYLLPHGQFYPPEREFSFLPHRDDWNLISSGGIIAQSLLYSLLLHSILIPDIIALWEDLLSFPEDKTDNPSPSHPLPKIQRVKCPRNRIGWKYYDFLEDLITVEGDIDHIPIAVHRQHVPGTHDRVRFPDCLCRSLPYLLLAPEPDFTLQEADFIFFISCP